MRNTTEHRQSAEFSSLSDDEKQDRLDAEYAAAERETAIERNRYAGEAAGLDAGTIAAGEASLRTAFALNDLFNTIRNGGR